MTVHEELAEIGFRNLRENRLESARWLAVEILLADPVALEDDDLVDRLCALQDRLEELARARYGLADAPLGRRTRPSPITG